MHLALGNGELASLKVGDYAAYERQTRRALGPSSPRTRAATRRRIRIANRSRRDHQRPAAVAEDRRDFDPAWPGRPPPPSRPQPGQPGLLQRAQLQVASEDHRRIQYQLLDPERDAARVPITNRGLQALPEPATGDQADVGRYRR